jgi:hypothetical protein
LSIVFGKLLGKISQNPLTKKGRYGTIEQEKNAVLEKEDTEWN